MMFMWWRTWHDEDRRMWAERFLNGDPKLAKQQHADDLRFRWADGLTAPTVTGLEFTDENGHTRIITGGVVRETPADRAYYVGGAETVLTRGKAEAHLADPGSTPGSSTGDYNLPF